MTFSNGNTINNIAYGSTTPGQSPITPASDACVAASKASFTNSCSQFGQQISYMAFGYYSNVSAAFFNNSKLSFLGQTIFDCSASPGLTISFQNMKIVSDGLGNSVLSGASNVNGPQANCASYLSATVTYLPTTASSGS
ncbi:hypothetical protein [Burkholderia perseverans]|uniref:hypothetical protein n=1 Tax=Burkholderia perseverans TaxID=2615214 RepID=UPI001FEF880F|nr:hypothetical protein [Burkholderia perseverans]